MKNGLRAIICLLLGSGLLFAEPDLSGDSEGGTSSGSSVEIQVVPLPNGVGPTEEELRALVEEAHEALEGEEGEGSFVVKWLQNFNYSKSFLRAHRWYLVKASDVNKAESVGNIVLMLVCSHLVETVGGTTFAYASTGFDVPLWLKGVFASVGMGITLPFLDPLCICLVLTYSKFPVQMNRVLNRPRLLILRLANYTADGLGLKKLFRKIVSKESAGDYLKRILSELEPGIYRWTDTDEGMSFEIFLKDPNKKIILNMKHRNSRLLLDSLEVLGPPLTKSERSLLNARLKAFGWNVRSAVNEAVSHQFMGELEKLEDLFHIDEVNPAPQHLKINYKTPAIQCKEVFHFLARTT